MKLMLREQRRESTTSDDGIESIRGLSAPVNEAGSPWTSMAWDA